MFIDSHRHIHKVPIASRTSYIIIGLKSRMPLARPSLIHWSLGSHYIALSIRTPEQVAKPLKKNTPVYTFLGVWMIRAASGTSNQMSNTSTSTWKTWTLKLSSYRGPRHQQGLENIHDFQAVRMDQKKRMKRSAQPTNTKSSICNTKMSSQNSHPTTLQLF